VFVTAYEQYAVQAFEQGALDYLVKPFDEARLAATVQRLRLRICGGLARRATDAGALPTPCSNPLLDRNWPNAAVQPRRRGAPAVDQGLGRARRSADPGGRGDLPAQRREVHAGGLGRWRGADPQAASASWPTSSTPRSSCRCTAR
jgi:hypothetical protein